MFGTISANAKAWLIPTEGIRLLGVCAGPDDVFPALRGTRTLALRLAQRYRSGCKNVDDLKADFERGFAALKANAWNETPAGNLRCTSAATPRRNGPALRLLQQAAISSVQTRIFVTTGDNHPFTMTMNAAVLSTK
jgi:hypothetical protein